MTSAGGVAYVSSNLRTVAYDVRTGTILRRLALGPNSGGVVVSDGALYGYDYGDARLARVDVAAATTAARPSPTPRTP